MTPKRYSKTKIMENEKKHFSSQDYIWRWSITSAGQKRYDNRFQLFKKICKPIERDWILEIGCGDGEFTKRLIKIFSVKHATDITFDVVVRAKKYISGLRCENISFEIDDAENLSFKDNTFNIVCGISILHHLDIIKGLKEVYRVLKDGGEIFFSEPNLLNPITFCYINIPWLRKKIRATPNEKAFIRWEVEKILKELGFREVKVFNYDFLFPGTPDPMVNIIDKIGFFLMRLPIVKEISGSLIIYAKK